MSYDIKKNISDVYLKKLNIISDSRGSVLHMIRSDAEHFKSFGEVYFSEIESGFVKGWKKHIKMTQNFAIPSGRVRFVIYDDRENSNTLGMVDDITLGRPNDYSLLIIPPGLWYAFESVDSVTSLVVNCASHTHDPDESLVKSLDDLNVDVSWRN